MWVATPSPNGNVIRVVEGGDITDTIELDFTAYACELGGPEGNTLFILGTDAQNEDNEDALLGKVATVKVDYTRPHYSND
jgi:sugar lactone lactonase YvrE